ncbi:MAG: prephenate dehydrogenase/arogenate dehydrogenase family protein [Blastochloris sp.]|nr:prephenate dehydrogenase/arogenate dehydrogenase family protein [Blastochloris sp.]
MSRPFDFQHIAIIGPGLLGGSIGLAAKEVCPDVTLSVWGRREEALHAVRETGFADRVSSSITESVEGCDLIILTTPIEVMADLARSFLPALAPGAIVTDVGSVKLCVHESLKPILGSERWIGSHPMAGSEQAGLAAARSDLFKRSVTVITPDDQTPPSLVSRISLFWQALGSRTVILDPALHDHLIADVSHLPHLLASVLVASIDEQSLPLAGPGFRDSTRIAAGSPALWREILISNRQAVAKSLDKFLLEAAQARDFLNSGDAAGLETILAKACQKRKTVT